jgi:3-oxoacyl-[acyl-carrier-protein] synthase-1
MEPVHITGMGLITSIGNNRDAVTHSLREMKHGIDFHPELQGDDSPVKLAGTVKEFNLESSDPKTGFIRKNIVFPSYYFAVFLHMFFMPGVHSNKQLRTPPFQKNDIQDPEVGMYTSSGGSMRSIHKHFEKMDARGVMACNPLAIVASIAGTLTFNLVAALRNKRIFNWVSFCMCLFRACTWNGLG